MHLWLIIHSLRSYIMWPQMHSIDINQYYTPIYTITLQTSTSQSKPNNLNLNCQPQLSDILIIFSSTSWVIKSLLFLKYILLTPGELGKKCCLTWPDKSWIWQLTYFIQWWHHGCSTAFKHTTCKSRRTISFKSLLNTSLLFKRIVLPHH